jgi:hypothetical protein
VTVAEVYAEWFESMGFPAAEARVMGRGVERAAIDVAGSDEPPTSRDASYLRIGTTRLIWRALPWYRRLWYWCVSAW